jgi:hypothetical protein
VFFGQERRTTRAVSARATSSQEKLPKRVCELPFLGRALPVMGVRNGGNQQNRYYSVTLIAEKIINAYSILLLIKSPIGE